MNVAGAMPSHTSIPSMYISKYNRFVDTILDRINKILRRSYDPVNVRLQNASDVKNNKKKNNNKNKNKKNNSKNRRRPPVSKKEGDAEITSKSE